MIKSYAKLNLHLGVLSKQISGYHKIETIVLFANIYDEIDIKSEALAWSIGRGARSGRVAWQYITDLAARTSTRLISKG